MANNWQIDMLAGLDQNQSREKINSQINKLKGQLKDISLTAKIDPKIASDIQRQLTNLQVNLTNVKISDKALNDMVSQINNALQGIKIPNINIGGSNGGNILGNNVAKLEEFRKSLSNIGMSSTDIDTVAQRIENLGVKINSLNQSLSHTSGAKGDRNLLNIEVGGIDEFGQAVKLTQTWDMDLGQLVKDVDAVSSATKRAGTSTDVFAKQQSQAVANLTNQINQLNRAANDQNAARPISDSSHLSSLSTAYNDIISAIQRMGNASSDTFITEQNNVKTLISDYKSLVSEFRNAENVSTKMKGTDLTSGLSIAKNDLEKFKADAKDFPQITQTIKDLDTAIANVGDASSLNSFNDQLRVARSELAKIKSETNASNRNEKVGINISGLQSKIADLQKISPEIDKFKTEINGAEVSVQSLLSDLSKISTQSDFSVVSAKFNAFTKAAEASGIAIRDFGNVTDSIAKKANEIQLSMGVNGDTTSQIEVLRNNFTKLGLSADEVKTKMSGVDTEVKILQSLMNSGADNSAIVTQFEKLQTILTQTQNNLKQTRSDYSLLATEQQRLSLANTIVAWNQKNTAATKEVRAENDRYVASLRDLNTEMTKMQFGKIQTGFKQNENSMRTLNKLGASLKDQMKQAANSFTQWISVSSAIMGVVYSTKQAVSELKNVDTYLTEISKANDQLSKSQLKQIGNSSFDVSGKYGKKATDYLSGVQEASRAGYVNAEGIAELSVAAQGAGDMTAELANQYIIATDKAYKFGGSVEKLTEVLDGSNYITNHNAVNMTELAEGMSIVGSQAASLGVGVDQTTAALGTMIATTQQSGSEMARAFKAILLNIQQVSDEEEGIDAEGLTKYEKACNALNVSLKETKNGVMSLRDPMEVIKDLSEEYTKLDANDIRRTNLLSSVGGKLRANALNALLENYDMYSKMLEEYSQGTGSMAQEAEKTSKSWEGSMNRLSNTWTKVVGNIANSDAIIGAVNGLNSLLSVIDKITSSLGSLGTIGLGAGLLAGIQNAGKCA